MHPCPKCGRNLQQSGEADCDGQKYAIYQCDECLANWNFGGEKFEVAFTFGVMPDGTLINPNDPNEKLEF